MKRNQIKLNNESHRLCVRLSTLWMRSFPSNQDFDQHRHDRLAHARLRTLDRDQRRNPEFWNL